MPIKINYNICDNSTECSGIAVCPTEAIYWDSTKLNPLGDMGTLCVDNSKCISCGQCVSDEGCPVGAIIFAPENDELDKLTADYKTDVNKVKKLVVERYGAVPINTSLCIDEDKLQLLVSDNKGIILVEEYTDISIRCLHCSIPVETIIYEIQSITGISDIRFYRIDVSNMGRENATLPNLKIYKGNNLAGQIGGYYSTEQLVDFMKLLKDILG